ncbi:hypothetical protein CH330_01215 [candidate division WOR-3 bacterium JGI_Cruoil_03_51_56]|uniref:peptidylprolyl isomerase n=1 Tax=candidate division WOR-3 bacterium JGI_Cruoil_03_51_56 TaxID=1973747 RepID=A0A235BXL3_UNCW3|nr:MAG: hypothetical protein CH330_01215 [candidate division WOR-3 bacterium JGI_Cruoil_03_51_56]
MAHIIVGGEMKKVLIIALLLVVAGAGAQKLTPALDTVYHLYLTHDYSTARNMLGRLKSTFPRAADRFTIGLEIGDLFLDKLRDYAAAESTYNQLLETFPKDKRRPDVIYRLALAQEMQEKFLKSAKNYEQVATRYMKSTYGKDALDAIERCFRKNYQDRVAYVNQFPITRIELDDRISHYPAAYDSFWKKQKLLDTMIDNRLLYEAALGSNIMADPTFANSFREMRNRTVFEEWYSREVTAKAEPKEKALKASYRRDKKTKYTTPEKVHAYHIVVPTKAQADSLRQLLLTDTTAVWDSIAKAFSTAPDKEKSGDMGLFAHGVQPKQIEKIAFRLKPGQMSKPIRTEDGFVILKVTEKKPKIVRPYDKVRNQILAQIRQGNINRLYEQKTDGLKNHATIEVDSTAIEKNKQTLAVVDGININRSDLEVRINTIPPFYRSQFQTPEGKRRILDQLIMEKLILKDCEAKKTWLWNRVIDKLLNRRSQMVIRRYREMMTTQKVKIDSTELKAAYRKNIKDFKVPAQAHAREIVTPTWTRALQLRRWAVAGRIPVMIAGRALVVTDSEKIAGTRETLAATGNTDSLIGLIGLADPPAVLPNTPVIRMKNRSVPDMSKQCAIAGPFRSEGSYGFAFADLSRADKLHKPELETAHTPEDIAKLLGLKLKTDTTGALVCDSNRFGTYVRLEKTLPSGYVKKLFKLDANKVSEPIGLENATLFVKVTKKDTARKISFADLAKRFSSSNSKWSGGDMQWLTRKDKAHDSKVIRAAFNLSKNRISRIIKLNDSTYTFIKIEDKKKAYTTAFDEVKAKIERELRRAQEQKLYDALIHDLRNKADIKVLMKESDFIFEKEENLPEQPTPKKEEK